MPVKGPLNLSDPTMRKHYWIWSAMMGRCSNPRHKHYHNYGGRGIIPCERWKKFANFFEDMGLRPDPQSTLERRDNNLGYNPGNCTWASRGTQAKNKRAYRKTKEAPPGVSPVRTRWRARIRVNGKSIHLGYFDTPEEASAVRISALDYHGFNPEHGR